MAFTEVRCPSCHAPIAETNDRVTCRYCGASLASAKPTASPRVRVVEHYAVKVRVGPSNVERVAGTVASERRLDQAAALAMVRAGDFELAVGSGDDAHVAATALAERLSADGAIATVSRREESIPLPPDVDVLLDDAGPSKAAVIAALRAHVDLGLPDAKRLVENAPSVLAQKMDGEKGQALVDALRKAGAKATTRVS